MKTLLPVLAAFAILPPVEVSSAGRGDHEPASHAPALDLDVDTDLERRKPAPQQARFSIGKGTVGNNTFRTTLSKP